MTSSIDPTGAGSSWDSATAAERVVRAYSAPDLAAIRTGQIDLLDPQPGATILDVGCGPGIFAVDLARRGARVTALDSAPSMLEAAAERAVEAGVVVELAEGDAEAIPFADGTFDAATLVQVLEYLGDPVGALRELARVVRPGGAVLAADTDWDTMAFAIEDLGLARRVALAWADGKAGGQAGRRIPGWLAAAGIEPEATRPQVLLSRASGGDTFLAHNWPYFRRSIERKGRVSGPDLDRFELQMAEADAEGRFLFAVVRHAWRGRVPGGSR